MVWNNKEKEKEYNKKYFKKWYPENRERCIKQAKEWRLANKEKMQESRLKWLRNNPWFKHHHSATNRCRSNGSYKKKGIKMFLTVKDIKFLWFRDKAFELSSPSIDRINSKKDYTLDNCRFIERSENCKLGSINRWKVQRIRYPCMVVKKKTIYSPLS